MPQRSSSSQAITRILSRAIDLMFDFTLTGHGLSLSASCALYTRAS